jgi:hypothetical protein
MPPPPEPKPDPMDEMLRMIRLELPTLDVHGFDFQLGVLTMLALNMRSIIDSRLQMLRPSQHPPGGVLTTTKDIDAHSCSLFVRPPVGLYCDAYEGGDGISFFFREDSGYTCVCVRPSGVQAFGCPTPLPPVVPVGAHAVPLGQNAKDYSEYVERIKHIKRAWGARGRIMLINMVLTDIERIVGDHHPTWPGGVAADKGTLMAALNELTKTPKNGTLNAQTASGLRDILRSNDGKGLFYCPSVSNGHTPADAPLLTLLNDHMLPIIDVSSVSPGFKLHVVDTKKASGGAVLKLKYRWDTQ